VLGPVDVAGPQIGAQQLLAGEDIQRQETILIVIPVKEAPFLLAMNGIVGGVEVQHHFLGRRLVRLDEQLDQQLIHLGAGAAIDAILQPAQRRRRGQRTLGVDIALTLFPPAGLSAGGQLEDQIVPQRGVVVEIFPAAGDPQHALGQQRPLLMLDNEWVAWIGDQPVDAVEQIDAAVHFTQKNHASVGTDRPGVESSRHFTSPKGCKFNDRLVTVCRHGLASLRWFQGVVTPESTRGRAVAL
jgi:hypothetical protein